MEHIKGKQREQITLFPESIEDYITAENSVRIVDVFVERLDVITLGFNHAKVDSTGRPPYNPKDLLKLYLYGYLNRVRTSRLLERETKRNLEVMWLLKRLSPDHKTISDFRRDNTDALRKVFKQFVVICKELELFGNDLVAIDSTKFKASNARDRITNKAGLEKSIARIDESVTQYLQQLDESDEIDNNTKEMKKEELQKKIELLKSQKTHLEKAKEELVENGNKYISLTDADCRLIKGRHGIGPAYRMHASVDSKHSLIVDYEITNDAADNNHLASMASAAKSTLGVENLSICSDAGYYDTVDLKDCEDNNILSYVPIPTQKVPKKTNVPKADYYHDKFIYDQSSDTYKCPQGEMLSYYTTTQKSDERKIFIYRSTTCKNCNVREFCTTSPRGRYVYRWEHEVVLDRLKQRLADEPEILKQRKAIIEHVFGTIKSIWDYGAFLLRGIKNVLTEVALTNTAYNLRRAITIIGTKKLIGHLQTR
jgi:transposase